MSDNSESDLVKFGKSLSKLETKISDIGGKHKEEKNQKQLEIETELNGLINFYHTDLMFNVKSTSQEQLKDLKRKTSPTEHLF